VSLTNGCVCRVCCSLRKNIVRALAELDRRASAPGKPFDGVFLETTGLVDPAPITCTFIANPLDSIALEARQHIVVFQPHKEGPQQESTAAFGTPDPKNKPKITKKPYQFLWISVLRVYLALELRRDDLPFTWDEENIYDDLVFL